MVSPILKQYADIKRQIALLEKQKEEIEEEVIEAIEENLEGRPEYVTSFGTFKVSGRRTYKYSSTIDTMQKSLYEAKKKEEHDGTAELVRHSSFPVFIPAKEEQNG
jgi:hypothetical protein